MEIVYALISVIIVSLISLIGIVTISIKMEKLKKILLYMVSLSVGGLLGGAFLHLLPEAAASGFTTTISLYVLSGIVAFFIIEKMIHWRHCHNVDCELHNKRLIGHMNLIGDGVHNFIDGLIIAASYLVSIPAGIAATLAVIMHEIPQEIGDFGVLVHSGFTRKRALCFNFLTALTAVVGTLFVFGLGVFVDGLYIFLVPFAAGGFIYIAGSDLIPELHKEIGIKKAILQLIVMIIGILIMYGLIFIE